MLIPDSSAPVVSEDGTTLYVGNLPFDTTEDQVQAMCAEHGKVVRASLRTRRVRNRNHRNEEGEENPDEPFFVRLSLGYAFVTFADVSSAKVAMSKLNDKDVGGRPLRVQVAKPPPVKEDREGAEGDAEQAEGGRRRRANKGGRRRTDAQDGEEAEVAAEDANGEEKKAPRRRQRKPAGKKENAAPGDENAAPKEPSKTSVFVANLPFSMEKDQLAQFFKDAGYAVVSATVPHKRMGNRMRSKGFGFVEFASEKDQQKAVDQMNGKEVEGREITIKISNTDAPEAKQDQE